jgi:hypothetical protein
LERLAAGIVRFGAGNSAEKLKLLRSARKLKIESARDVLVLHRCACFLRAFPDDAEVLFEANALIGELGARVRGLPIAERGKLDDSGIAGSRTRHTYSHAAAAWLATRFPNAVDIDWPAFENPQDLGAAVAFLLNPLEDEVTDFSGKGFLTWLSAAKGEQGDRRKTSDLGWLLAQRPAGDVAAAEAFERAYDAADVPLRWTLEDCAGAIASAVVPRPIVYRSAMRRPSTDTPSAVRQPLDTIRHINPDEARDLIDVWRAALWARARTIFQIEQADCGNCFLAGLGEGLELAIVGVPPARRSPLEVNYGYLLLSNGMAVGYGGFTPLFAQVNTGINVFPDFRGSEAAFAWQQMLRTMHTMTECARFIINPYQLGAGNDEALKSGAYWFYHRLGFRSADPVARDLAEREFAKMSGERGYRPPVAVLRKIAASDVHLDLRDDAPDLYFEESYLEPIGRGVTESIARERVTSRSAAVERLSRRITDALGLAGAPMTEAERRGFGQFAPILAQIPDLDEWNPAEKLALAELCRLRWADTELGFLTAMRRHSRLRTSLAYAARRRLQANGGGRGERER